MLMPGGATAAFAWARAAFASACLRPRCAAWYFACAANSNLRAASAAARAPAVASCHLGAFPPVDLRAVCFILAMMMRWWFDASNNCVLCSPCWTKGGIANHWVFCSGTNVHTEKIFYHFTWRQIQWVDGNFFPPTHNNLAPREVSRWKKSWSPTYVEKNFHLLTTIWRHGKWVGGKNLDHPRM